MVNENRNSNEMSIEEYMVGFEKRQAEKGKADIALGGSLPNPEHGDCYNIRVISPPKPVANEKVAAISASGASLTMRVELTAMNEKLIPKYTMIKVVKMLERVKDQIPAGEYDNIKTDAMQDTIQVGQQYDVWISDTYLRSMRDEIAKVGIPEDKKFTCLIGREFQVCGNFFLRQGKPAKSIKVRLINHLIESGPTDEEIAKATTGKQPDILQF